MNEIYICRTCKGETEYYYDERWDTLASVKCTCTCWNTNSKKPSIKALDAAFLLIDHMTMKEKQNYE